MLVSQPRISAFNILGGAVGLGVSVSPGVNVRVAVASVEAGVMEGTIGVNVSVTDVAKEGKTTIGVGVRMRGVRDGTGVGGLYVVVLTGQSPQAERAKATHVANASKRFMFHQSARTDSIPKEPNVDEQRDDRITPETKIIGASVIVVLLLAFLALYIFPTHADIDFAWTIVPPTSAILIGAGYTAGAYFFSRVVRETHWHRVQAGFLPITAFTICMLVATLLHWDRFHQGALAFYMWFIIYLITPFVVPFLWWRNRSHAYPGLEQADLRFPAAVRWVLGVGAGIGVALFVIIFINPSILIALAPWKLTPLTARVFAGWSILTLATVLSIALDGRWSATRILMESAMVGLGLTAVALPRMWADFDHSKPMTTLFVAGIFLTLIVFAVLHVWLDARAHRGELAEAKTVAG
jgi:hypothetical protein